MIHHLSVAARDPKAVADFFAELIDGVSVDFPPNPGSFMVFKADGHGTAIEIYPAGSVMAPNGDPGAVFLTRPTEVVERTPTHFAISVDRDAAAIRKMAEAHGWDCFVCDRGGHFHVVEVWIENAWLVEALPPAFAAEYLDFANAVSRMGDPTTALEDHAPQARTLERV
ncbi:VOC family protein [Brevundimonas sp. R86498]|uniref:VOC family protein n=1 Tax=Brevundimonas sp. R86498 TaxID=3093845 RepID=UPI0037C6D587